MNNQLKDGHVLTENTFGEFEWWPVSELSVNFESKEVAELYGYFYIASANKEMFAGYSKKFRISPEFGYYKEFLEICGKKAEQIYFKGVEVGMIRGVLQYTPNVSKIEFENGCSPQLERASIKELSGLELQKLDHLEFKARISTEASIELAEWLPSTKIKSFMVSSDTQGLNAIIDMLPYTDIGVLGIWGIDDVTFKYEKMESVIQATSIQFLSLTTGRGQDADGELNKLVTRVKPILVSANWVAPVRKVLKTLLLETDLDVNLVKGLVSYLHDKVEIVN